MKKTLEDPIDHSKEAGTKANHSYSETKMTECVETTCNSCPGEPDAPTGTNSPREGSDAFEALSAVTPDVDKEGPSCSECLSA